MYIVIYDGECNLCVTLVQLLEKLDRGQRFAYVPMQAEAQLQSLDVTAADCELGMLLIDMAQPEQRWQGSEAAEEIGRILPLGSVFVQAYRSLPGIKSSGDRAYAYIRDHRYEIFGKRSDIYEPVYPVCESEGCQGVGESGSERLWAGKNDGF